MSRTNNNQVGKDLKEAKAIIKRFNQGKQTPDDEKKVSAFAHPGEPDWSKALDRFLKSKQQAKEAQLNLFFENGLMMPFKDDDSAVPKEILRGSLFAPITRGRRKLIQDKVLAQYTNGEIRYSGAQLNQADLDVLLQLIKLLSEFTKSDNVERITDKSGETKYSQIKFMRYGFLKALGRSDGQNSYKALELSLNRLGGRLHVIEDGQGLLNGPILGEFVIMEDGRMAVDINHRFVKLFGDNNFSFIDMDSRLELTGDFTKWLQGFVSTHTGESQYSAEKLKELSGSKQKSVKHWILRQAKPAFEQLKDLRLIKDYSVKGHLFTWVR